MSMKSHACKLSAPGKSFVSVVRAVCLLEIAMNLGSLSSFAALYCESEDQTATQSELCSIFDKVESGVGCSSFQDSVGRHVCLSLENLMSGGNCTNEFNSNELKEDQIRTLITCHEIYSGMQNKSCDSSMVNIYQNMGRSLGMHFQVDIHLGPASRKALCHLGHSIEKNRLIYAEKRKNAIIMASVQPLIEQSKTQNPTEVKNLLSHFLRRLDELKIGKKDKGILGHDLNHSEWIDFFKDLVQIIEKNRTAWVQDSLSQQKPIHFESGTSIGKDTLPAGVSVLPDGRIIVFFDRLRRRGDRKERPFQPIGEGGYKKVYLAFDYKKSIEASSDGLSDPATLIGGYIKPHEGSSQENLLREIQEEVQFQNRFTGQLGIASHGEVLNHQGKTPMSEKLVILEPYYPLDLIRFRTLLNHPELESINGRTRERVVLKVAKSVLMGLSHLHKNGINHRDIKPDNILVDVQKDGHYRGDIADFGLALDLSHCQESPGCNKVAGTPAYMSPEYASELGQTGERANKANKSLKNDVWAMGLTLWFLDSGTLHLPTLSASGIKSYADLESKYGIALLNSGKPPREKTLKYVIYRMLNPDESQRISSEDALKLLEEIQPDVPYSATDYLAQVQFSSRAVSTQEECQELQSGDVNKFELMKLKREMNAIERDSKYLFKKELTKHKNY